MADYILLQKNIAGATVWSSVDGFGKRRSSIKLEGITGNMPLVIEVVDLHLKLNPLLFELKRMVEIMAGNSRC